MPHGAPLELHGVTVTYGSFDAVRDLDLRADAGEVLCVLGPSGCGKSTLLRAVAGLEPSRTGSVRLGDRTLDGLRPDQRDVGLMFQDHALFPHRTVADNVAFGPRMRGLDRRAVAGRVDEALRLVDLTDLARRRITELSGGEQQRVALARAVAPRPQLLMLDEPLGSLDRALQARLLEDLTRVFGELGTTVLHVTHDQHEALAVADRVAVMRSGRVEQVGSPDELWRGPRTAFVARFLGLDHVVRLTVRDGVADSPWGTLPVPTTRDGTHDVVLLPEALRVLHDGEPLRDHELAVTGRIVGRRFAGDHIRVTVDPGAGPALSVPVWRGSVPEPGSDLDLALDPRAARVLEPEATIRSR